MKKINFTEKESGMIKALIEYTHYDGNPKYLPHAGVYLYNIVQGYEGWNHYPDMREIGGVLSSLKKKGIIEDCRTLSDSSSDVYFTREGYKIAKEYAETFKGYRTRKPATRKPATRKPTRK